MTQLAWGILLAYAALPFLMLTVPAERTAASRQRAWLVVLALDVALLAVPSTRDLAFSHAGHALAGLELQALHPAAGHAERALSHFSFFGLSPAGILSGLWLLGVAIAASRRALDAARVLRARQSAGPAEAGLLAQVDSLARSIGLRPPHVRTSDKVQVPFVTGLARPTLVLPERLVASLDGTALDLALRHELQHLARGDHFQAALVSALRVFLPLHPAAPRLLARYTLAREEAIDALVAPLAPRAYASLLLHAAMHSRQGLTVAMGAGSLESRLKRLTGVAPKKRARFTAGVALFVLFAATSLALPSVAAGPAPTDEAPTARDEAETLSLAVGSQTVISVPGVERIAIGDPQVADIRTLGQGRIEVVGVASGGTKLVIWTRSSKRVFSVRVSGSL